MSSINSRVPPLRLMAVDTPTDGQIAVYQASSGQFEWVANSGGGGTVTSIDFTAPLTGGAITSSGTVGITQSSATTNGYLSSTDWTTFNNKQDGITQGNLTETTSSILTISGGSNAVIDSRRRRPASAPARSARPRSRRPSHCPKSARSPPGGRGRGAWRW